VRAASVLEEGLRIKRWARDEALKELGPRARLVERDEHAHRPPRPCGMTIHPAYGCTLACRYCYVSPAKGAGVKLAELSGYELALALCLNPHFLPGKGGTLVAFGSITECFLNEETTTKTLEYMEWISRLLGNPQQVSTKMLISDYVAESVKKRGDANLSVLVSLACVRFSGALEPASPKPSQRLKRAGELATRGLRVAIFVRPILPSVTDRDFSLILDEMEKNGLRELVLGSLMVNREIVAKIERSGIRELVYEVEKRAGRVPEMGLAPISARDIKESLRKEAQKRGFVVHPSACSANIASHGMACWACAHGPCGERKRLPELDDPSELFEIAGRRPLDAWVDEDEVIHVVDRAKLPTHLKRLIESAAKRRVVEGV